MKYFDYYLKADAEQQLIDSLIAAELASKETLEDEQEYLSTKDGVNLDIIGIIYKNIGTEEEPDYVEQLGYHANLRLKEQLSQEREDSLPLIIPPDTPVRVWA